MNWDDLKVFAVTARLGSFSKAAEELGTTHTTVSRRISALEEALDLRLFDRLSTGLVLTCGGEELHTSAAAMELEAEAAERQVSGRDSELRGEVRVSIIDAMAVSLMPAFGRFLQAYPGIKLTISTSTREANLARREADIAIRIGNTPPETLVGRRVTKYQFALYGAKTLLERFNENTPAEDYPWVAWGDNLAWPALRKLMARRGKNINVVARIGGAIAMADAVCEGIGVGYLAVPKSERDPRLVRLEPIEEDLALDVWLLTHPDLRHTGRIRAFMDFIAPEIKQDFEI